MVDAQPMKIFLLAALLVLAVAAPAAAETGPALAVDASADRRAISEDIYGMNFADPVLAREIGLPVDRWGGNKAERYNWQAGLANTAADYFFESLPDCWEASRGYCSQPGASSVRAYRDFVEKDRAAGARTLLALPMTGYVTKGPALYGHPFPCSYPRTAFASQQSFDPFDADCGNGKTPAGADIPGNDPTRTGLAAGPAWSADWIADLKARYGDAAGGGVGLYELGNEPNLYSSTHRDVHPDPMTYDELSQRSRDLALAVKSADPSAKTLGFSEWGWPNYFCSAADEISDGCSASDPDRAAHGGKPLVEWFLEQMRGYEQANGKRLLDYLDLHYYAQGGSSTEVTRSLWDPSYPDPSWIADRIELLPRMRRWVADRYPGTKLALSEYDLSVGDETTRVLIQADALGIFAREGLDLATRWSAPAAGDAQADAWRLYRNFDGAGGRFGDTWVRSTSAHQGSLAVYGAQRSADGALTIAVINKSAASLTSTLSLAGATPAGPAKGYRWVAAGSGLTATADQAVGATGFEATYPGRSMTLLVVPTRAAPGPGPSPSPGPAMSSGPTPRPGTPSPAGSGRRDVTPPTVLVGPRSIRADRTGLLTLTLLPRDEVGQVKVSLTLRAKVGRRTLIVGGGSYRVPGSRLTRASVRLTATGAAALRRARRLTLTVAALATDAAGLRRTTTAKIRVRAAPKR